MSASSDTPPAAAAAAAADAADAASETKASPRSERGPADDHRQDSDPPNSSPRSPSGNKRSLEPDTDGSEAAGSVSSNPPRKRSKSQQRPDDDVDTNNPHPPEGEEPPPLPVGESPPPLPAGEEPPPLPVGEDPPPLPNEPPPEDDGWDALWDEQNQAFYFHNRFTNVSQWENPRVPEGGAAGTEGEAATKSSSAARPHGGYNPAIHGDYDPNADYAIAAREAEEERANAASAAAAQARAAAQGGQYDTTGAFNRFTGQWQSADQTPDRHNDENKSKRQMNAFFDVDAAANSHGGRSLKAERQSQKLSKAELKAFKEKRRERKEEKRRAWLRD